MKVHYIALEAAWRGMAWRGVAVVRRGGVLPDSWTRSHTATFRAAQHNLLYSPRLDRATPLSYFFIAAFLSTRQSAQCSLVLSSTFWMYEYDSEYEYLYASARFLTTSKISRCRPISKAHRIVPRTVHKPARQNAVALSSGLL